MELYEEMLRDLLARATEAASSTDLAAALIEAQSYQTLCEIKRICEDETLADDACFQKIEAIVRTLEDVGSSGGTRHDFG